MDHLSSLLGKFEQARVLVVGDVYLDEVVLGSVTGVSREAPVPIFEESERLYNPGAAGNVACNLAAMGAKTHVVGVTGADRNSDLLREGFRQANVETGGLVSDADHPTNTYGKLKARMPEGSPQEILRADSPAPEFISDEVEAQVLININEIAKEVDAIVVVDQASSVVTEAVLEEVLACAEQHNVLIVGDSRNRIGKFKEFALVVPNDLELGLGMDMSVETEEEIRDAVAALLLVCQNAFITRGAKGIYGFTQGSEFHKPSLATEVVDVTGAGDTVTAATTLTLLAGGSEEDAAAMANVAAAIAVGKPGAVAVTAEAIEQRLSGTGMPTSALSLEELQSVIEGLRKDDKTIVWTNGCFDILHAGHVTYLSKARREGDVLVVGLNSDASVSAVKGPDRPVVPEDERALIISSLKYVDYVIVFSDDDVVSMLEALQPDVYAKGGDYTLETINQDERKVVEGYGGRIALISGVEGKSTTNIVQRLSGEYEE